MQALGEVSQAVNSTLDLETVLTTIAAEAVELRSTDAGAIYVFDEERKEFACTLLRHERSHDSGDQRPTYRPRRGTSGPRQHSVSHPSHRTRNEPASPVNEIVLREGYRRDPDHSPVSSRPDRRRASGPAQDARGVPTIRYRSVQTFADQSVVAIQNARLYENVETRTHELAKSLKDAHHTGSASPDLKAGLPWSAHRRHRARDQEPAQLRQ